MEEELEIIRQQIIVAKEDEPTLAGLTSTSRTAIWLGWVNVVANAFYNIKQLWAAFKNEILLLIASRQSGTTGWYAQRVLEFQYGDSITMVGYVPKYLVIDASKRIVKEVSVVESGSGIAIKVAKLSGSDLVPLNLAEKTALQTYVNRIKFAGVSTGIISLNADIVKADLIVYYDGQLVKDDVQVLVEQALNSYLNGIDFDGVLHLQKLVDAVQLVEGVNDLQLNSLEAKADSDVSYTPVTLSYSAKSGYFKLADVGSETIIDLIAI